MHPFAKTFGVAAAGALVGGCLSAFLVTTLRTPPEPMSNYEARPADAKVLSDSQATALEVRIAELEGKLDRAERQRRSRESLEDYARTLAKDDKPANPGATPVPAVQDAEDPRFELAVRSVLDRVDWERNEEERLTQAQQRSERAERQTALLSNRLSLSHEQAQAVALALAKQMESFRALREAKGEQRPESREQWREKTAAIRTETEKQLGEILDEDQMKGYRAFVEEEGLGPRAWGSFRRDRNPEPPPQ